MTTSILYDSHYVSSTDDFRKIRIILVGQNRPRLLKILSLVKALEETQQEQSDGNYVLSHEYIPCLATMDSYENTDGLMIRYMSNFISLDGSSMMKYFDDDEYRQSLQLVMMVGYEWNYEAEEDVMHIRSYFQANHFDQVSVECVVPTSEFVTLQDELKYFKELSDDDKLKQETRQQLGPWKMARFVVDSVQSLKRRLQVQHQLHETRNETQKHQQEYTMDSSNNAREVKATNLLSPHETGPRENDLPQEQNKPILRINPSLPIFACRICRTPLLDQSHLAMEHVQNLHSFRRLSNATVTATNSKISPSRPCQSLFCDESVLHWLSSSSSSLLEGRLSCFKCSNKLGHWKWSGSQCSCGTWVVPAIQIPLSKVDTILYVPRTTKDDIDDEC
jgi:dual specificity phosphatase 12